MNPVAIAFTALTAVGLAGALISERRGSRRGLYIGKPLASTGFLGVAYANEALQTSYGRAVFAALVLSFLGDVFLMSKETKFFRAGLFAFLAGHIAFTVAFVLLGQTLMAAGGAAVALTLAAVFVGRWLVPHVQAALRGPVVAYIAVISLMVIFAVGASSETGRWPIALAAIAFYGSDLSVARGRFLGAGFGNRLWGLPLYYAAQLAFAWELGA